MGACQGRGGHEDESHNEAKPEQLNAKLESLDGNNYEDNEQQQQEMAMTFQKEIQELEERNNQEIEEIKNSDSFQQLDTEEKEEFLGSVKQKQEQMIIELNSKHQSQMQSPTFNRFVSNDVDQVENQEGVQKNLYSEIVENFDRRELENFYVVTTIFSPITSKTKIEAYRNFAKMCEQNGLRLITIEFTSQGCPFVATEQFFEPYHIQIRVQEALFLKNNLINTIVNKLPDDWSWICVVDYNVVFRDFSWVQSVQNGLQEHIAMQIFESAKPISKEEQHRKFEINTEDNQSDTELPEKDCLAKHLSSLNLSEFGLSEMAAQFEFGKGWAYRRDFVEVFGLQDFFVTGFEELYFLLCLEGKCSDLCRGFYSEKVLDFIEGYENDFQQRNLSYGYVEDHEIEYYQIGPDNYKIEESLDLMRLISENLQKDKEGIFITDNEPFKTLNEGLKNSIL